MAIDKAEEVRGESPADDSPATATLLTSVNGIMTKVVTVHTSDSPVHCADFDLYNGGMHCARPFLWGPGGWVSWILADRASILPGLRAPGHVRINVIGPGGGHVDGVDDDALRRVGATRRLVRKDVERCIVAAAVSGYSQTRTAELLGVSQPHVGRTLADVRRRHGGELVIDPATPSEVIDRRDAGHLNTDEMMAVLGEMEYTEGHVPDVGNYPADAYVRGSWDDVEYAYHQGRLSFEQYETLYNQRHLADAPVDE